MASLLVGLFSLLVWVLIVFIRPIGLGVAHLLLGLGAVLIVRWYALRDSAPRPS